MTHSRPPRSPKVQPAAYTVRIVGADGREIVPGTPEAEPLTRGVTAFWAEAIAAEWDAEQHEQTAEGAGR